MVDLEGEKNYPDLLGTITRGARLNLDIMQCAMAIRPVQVPAGRFFEVILLLQNAVDIDVDVVVGIDFPEREQAKRFSPVTPHLRVGLQPGEVGFVTLPVATSPLTPPRADYVVELRLDIKRLGKKPQRIRAATGGGAVEMQGLSVEAQAHLRALRDLVFSVMPARKKNRIMAPFAVVSPTLTQLSALKGQQAHWTSLWTLADYLDDAMIADCVREKVEPVLAQLRRENIFMPLLKVTQARFEACRYPLWPPEAIFITKLLTLLLENGIGAPGSTDSRPAWPRWFRTICRLLFQEERLATRVDVLVAEWLYPDIIHDATLQGFAMVSAVTKEDFGPAEETTRYAEALVKALVTKQPLDMTRAYLPLVMGGLIVGQRVTMPREQVHETVFTLAKALEKRSPEKNADNAFIFDITRSLVDRALDTM